MSFKVAKAECLDFSPTFVSHCNRDKLGKENNTSIPVLSLLQFSKCPFVSFGMIKLGSSKSLPLRIENPTEDATTTVIVDKIAASKGFSVDQTSFTMQPEGSIILTVTWTPVEEGGVRELLSFVANGIVKHQAILLGKAQATKKKKKTLWDSIKSKKGVPAPSKEKKVSSMPIKAANMTFHVSRQSQYRKDRTSNPLLPLNQERFAYGSNAIRTSAPSSTPEMSKPVFVTEKFDDVHLQKNSPVVVLVPAERFLDTPGNKDMTFSRKAECKEITRVLNKTLSPASTPERFGNPLCFQSPLPMIGQFAQDQSQEPEKPSLSVKGTLDVIGSDLSHAVSLPNACSSFDFSVSLESEKPDPERSFRATAVISPPVEVAHPRLTFCVKPNKVIGVESNHDAFRLKALPFCTATVTKLSKVDDALVPDGPKKFPVNSTTVTKGKPEASVESPGLRKKKTSRRRLLEKTLELSEASNAESNASSPDSALPVISSDSSPDVALESKSSVTSVQVTQEKPTSKLSPPEQLLSSISSIRPQVLTMVSSSPSSGLELAAGNVSDKVQPGLYQDQFPVQSKKRKSDEFLRGQSEDETNVQQAKKCRAPTHATERPSHERTFTSRSTSRPQRKAIAPPSSRKFTKPPPKKSSPKTTQKDGRSVKSLSISSRKPARIVAVAQAKLTFIKPSQTAIPRHPLPFAAKNMFYDERWIEKQERGFTWWMNYVLTPDDFKVATEVTKVNALSLTMGNDKFNIPKAPTKEEMSFRTYTARQLLNRLRRAACKLFTSDTMVKAIQRLELEVEAKRLLVRKDRHLWKDIGERQKVLNWLISFNPLWLRIGLETIYGELISLESNNDVMGLAMFILGRLLWNPDLAAEFRHPKVPHLYRDGHEEALSRFTLKKLILLVCFLDKAKESRLIEHDPCLFCMDAEFKSSKDLLLAFSRDFLSGEGILSRHLSHLGLAVSHVQTPLDEFNFAVKNLAVDLRCGIRLVRVMELFTLDWTLSRKLRIPAISRLQKVHNVDVALQVLKDKGVDLKDEHGANIDSRDIVDGHREKTLNLLWKIIFAFQVEVLLDENQLKEEISFLRKTWRTKQKLASLMANSGVAVTRMKSRQAFEHPSQKVTLLMDWVSAVCEFYNIKAENFTVSFSDGRILCYLIHHYHPGHLPEEEIQQRTTQTIECGHRGRVELNNSSTDSDCSFENLPTIQTESPSVDFKELLEKERNNFQLVNTAVSYLGGVPAMINPEDMSNTIPNEKVVTCYLSFLCARLLDLRNETRAARVIQGAWRRYKLQKNIELIQQRNLSATKIQALVRKFILRRRMIKQNKAAIMIQIFWRGYVAREKLRGLKKEKQFALQNAAATVIQKTYKAWRIQSLLKKNHAASVIQAAFQKWHAKKLLERNAAALCIQAWYRMQRCKTQYLDMKSKAVCVQAWFRGHFQRCKFQTLKKRHNASVVIQSAFRAYLVRQHVSKMKQNAVLIQRWFRACMLRKAEQKRYFKIKSAVLALQAAFRGWKVQRSVAQRHQAAILIQAAFRRFMAQRHYLCLKRSAIVLQQRYRAKVLGDKLRQEYMALKLASVTIQAIWRGRAERKKISQLHRFAGIIQSNYRRYVAQTRFLEMKQAAVVIQRKYRAFRDGRKVYAEYTEIKRATIVLQSAYRGKRARQELQKKNKAATLIQSVIRAHRCHQRFLALKRAAIVIQQRHRALALGRLERSHYVHLRQATITLQAIYRGSKVRQNLRQEHQAATIIQAQFRMHKVRVAFLAAKCAAIIIQQQYRAYRVGKCMQATYLQTKNAAVVIQSAFRGMKVRNYLRKSHQAATVIQAHFRGHSQLKKYQRQQWAASILQQRFRAMMTKNAVVKSIKTAAICIQSAFRGMMVRKQIAERHKSAKMIQKTYRAYKQRRDYLALRNATIRIQQQYRAIVSARQQRKRFCSLRAAAITLQSMYRGMRLRKEIDRKHKAATVIQAMYKMYRTRVPFQAMKLAALVIQRQYRCHLLRKEARENFLKLRCSAIAIQAIYRGNRARRDIARMNFAATVIQRKYLAYKQRKCFLSIRAAVEFCQRHYRSVLVARHDRRDYFAKRRAVVAIQATFRGMQVRRQIRREHEAATIIQSHVRKHILKLRFQRLRWAVCTVQQRFRANKMMKREMAALQEQKSAALILQAAYRGMKSRQTVKQIHQAATTVQATFRAYSARKRYLAMKCAAIVIQQRYRATNVAKQQRKHFLEMCQGALVVQACYRGLKVRRKLLQQRQAAVLIQSYFRRHKEMAKYQAMRLSVIVIQSHYRSYTQARADRENYLCLRKSAIVIQAAYRGKRARQELQKKNKAATLIQSVIRAHRCRQRFLALKRAAIVIQQRHRALALGRLERNHYVHLRQATITLQAICRGSKVRQNLRREHQAATIIQAKFRMHKVRVAFLAAKCAAIIIQQQYRAYRVGKCMQATYLQTKNAAVVIQSAFRGMKVRNYLRKSHQAATVIQAHFRGHSQLKKYQRQQWAASILQQRFRAMMTKNAVVKRYAAIKTAAICIQSAFRGMMVRKQIAERHKSAKMIQKTYRAYKQRRDYLALRNATFRIQQQYRAIVSTRQQRKRFCSLRAAAITLQSMYRGMRLRKEIDRKYKAATVIQAMYKMYRTRVPFQAMKLAALVIQRQYRCHLLRKEARENFLKLRCSAIAIQAIYRGNRARRDIARMNFAATVIQRKYLAYKQRKCFLSIRAAVEFCQRHYRSVLVARRDRTDYFAKRRAVVAIQATFRGMQVRRQIRREHEAATIIQSHVRKHILKLRFQRLRWAVCTVQQRFRANKMMKREMAALQEQKSAALILQAAYRGMKSRQTVKQIHQAATTVQATFRAYSARKRYLAMKCAAIVIQQRYRATNVAKQQRKHFLEMCQGAFVVQACYRGLKVRKKLLQQRQAAVLIQSCFRRHKEMAKYQAMRLSAIVIQSHYRSYTQARADRENYLSLRKSAIVIQAAFRGHSLRRQLAEKQEASIIIQAAFRMYQQRSAFKRQRWAARVLQQRFRALKLRDEQMCRYQQARNAAVCLQKSFRGMKGRELARWTKAARTIQSYLRMAVQRQRFLKEKAAAITIQSAYRGHCARVQHARMQASATLIQKWYRSCKLVQKDRNGFVALKQATLTLQSALRGMLVRRLAKRRRAAIKIQSAMHMHVHRKRYVLLRSSVLKLQAHYRMFVDRRRCRRLQAATVTFQKHYRAHRATVEQRSSYLKTLQNIKILQARVRGHIEYRRFQRLRASAITIQAHYRGMIKRRRFQHLKESVLVIQKHYRAFRLCQRERAQFLQLQKSAVLIQTAFRAYQTRQHAVRAQAARKIQAWFRGRIARRNYILKQAAVATISRCIQARRQRSRFLAVQRSVRVIQQRWRETLIARKQHADFLRFRKSVLYIQALWRGQRVRDSIQKQITAAVKIQSAFRGFSQRRRYRQQRDAAIILQRHFRFLRLARIKEENLRRRHNAAVYLQALWRGWLARQQVKEMACAVRRHRFTAAVYHHLCAKRIQRAVRAHWALKSAKRKISSVLYIQQCFRAKLQRKGYLKDREDIIKSQRAVRTWLHHRNKAAATIQYAVRKLLLRRRKERLQRGIIKAQALWRGHRSRKHHDTSKVISMRRRLREVNRGVKEEDKLCNKTTTALSYLLGLQNYAYILAALKHLETATRLSPECCERLVESGATHTIFTLIRSCNRSVPSMEIIILSIQVLLNLSKYNRTIDAVYDVDNSVETLLDLLQIYREKAGDKVAEKGGSIFTKACFLLVLLVQDDGFVYAARCNATCKKTKHYN
ncbi:abnormal spindle-like microcephaly-associated protein homolog [Sinocyclocheilus rhinocerous]|uniref:abnormal spindle-like microcephaly-associated protein homolog n=1 Tax=Sinocyclocheilus rhinocerous TaxID=307959 RepID=UPI0007B96FAF|nr:PREDICTED: abnormal spindle-like microcephaly-associated protein homolog [Sinocyclocheilus rhinocerous]